MSSSGQQWVSLLANPLILLGSVILLGTGLLAAIVDAPLVALLAQSTLPVGLGTGLIAYGWYLEDDLAVTANRQIATWIGVGVLAFSITGFWFGQISRLFETSFLMAIYASLVTGAAFGCAIGIYAARVHRTKERLTGKNERMAEFANIVSHDLRSPLTVAKGRLHIARQSVDDEQSAQDEHLETAAEALDRMDDLIGNLLTLTLQGDLIDETEPVELASVATECWGVVATAEANLSVEDELTIAADRDRLRQLLENLFRNAVEHGGEDVTIRLGQLNPEPGFYVEDDGPGIRADDRTQVFDSGFSMAESGTGFGLAIVQDIVEAHGWDVEIREGMTGGGRFEFGNVTIAETASN